MNLVFFCKLFCPCVPLTVPSLIVVPEQCSTINIHQRMREVSEWTQGLQGHSLLNPDGFDTGSPLLLVSL